MIENSDEIGHESYDDDVNNLAPTVTVKVLSSPHLLGIASNHGVLRNPEFLEHLINIWFPFTVLIQENCSTNDIRIRMKKS